MGLFVRKDQSALVLCGLRHCIGRSRSILPVAVAIAAAAGFIPTRVYGLPADATMAQPERSVQVYSRNPLAWEEGV